MGFCFLAPRRKAAEELARQLAHELPETEILELTPSSEEWRGRNFLLPVGGWLSIIVVWIIKSGPGWLSSAKAGQLQVVVATTGLGAGVNFSMRSVCDRQSIA